MASGLVERRAHAEHRRALQSYLTEDGQRLLRVCRLRVSAVEERMVFDPSKEERLRLIRALRGYADALGRKGSG